MVISMKTLEQDRTDCAVLDRNLDENLAVDGRLQSVTNRQEALMLRGILRNTLLEDLYCGYGRCSSIVVRAGSEIHSYPALSCPDRNGPTYGGMSIREGSVFAGRCLKVRHLGAPTPLENVAPRRDGRRTV